MSLMASLDETQEGYLDDILTINVNFGTMSVMLIKISTRHPDERSNESRTWWANFAEHCVINWPIEEKNFLVKMLFTKYRITPTYDSHGEITHLYGEESDIMDFIMVWS